MVKYTRNYFFVCISTEVMEFKSQRRKGKTEKKKKTQKDRTKHIITTVEIVKLDQIKDILPRWIKPANMIIYYV